MKRCIALFLILTTLLSFTSCMSDTSGGKGGYQGGGAADCSHNWQEATCNKSKTCAKCGETLGEPLGHTTEFGVCSRCGENLSDWELGEFVDEFEQPTGIEYLAIWVKGTFSNSATTNSKLDACIQVTSNDIAFMLLEYGSHLVKGTFDSNPYSITVLDQNGVKHYLDGNMYEDGTRVYLSNSDESELLNLLKKPGEITFHLKYSKYSSSTYLFKVRTDGFASLYSNMN